MISFSSKSVSSLLGLSFDGRRLKVVSVRRSGEDVKVQKTAEIELSLDPLANEPELVGREIRDFLDASGLHGSRCLACVPVTWALSFQTELPDLAEEDAKSMLMVQAEREFPFAPEDLAVSIQNYSTPDGKRFANVVAIPKKHVLRLEQALGAAKLQTVGVTMEVTGLEALRGAAGPAGVTLVRGEKRFDLLVTVNGGLVALRALDEFGEAGLDDISLQSEKLGREIKITLGQLSGAVRTDCKTVSMIGAAAGLDELARDLHSVLEPLGLQVTTEEPSNALVNLVADCLHGKPLRFEFLPPRITKFQELTHRFSSRKNFWLGSAAAAIVLITSVSFYLQGSRLRALETQWNGMADKVKELETIQGKIRQFRPWFDDSIRSLVIASHVTEAFPEEGEVWVKELEIRNQVEVYCSGFANSNRALLATLDNLRDSSQVADLQIQQVRGDNPLNFAFNFNWIGGPTNE